MGTVLFDSETGPVRPKDIAETLQFVGIEQGDIVMVHARLFTLGRLHPGVEKDALADTFIDTLLTLVGPEGTVIFPTFSLAVCKSGIFSHRSTRSEMGLISERARVRNDSVRTQHPFFSVAVVGARKEFFKMSSMRTCFGEDSVFDFLHKINEEVPDKGRVKFLTIGIALPPEAITYLHAIEEKMGVPYRYHKSFQGIVQADDKDQPYEVSYFVRDLSTDVTFDAETCWDLLKNKPSVVTKRLGNASVSLVPEAIARETLITEIRKQNDILCKGGYRKN